MQTTADASPTSRSTAVTINRLAYRVCQHWMALFILLFGLYVGLPFLAPLLMAAGLSTPGQIIYAIYAFLCHQLPERSFFFFGPKFMVPLSEIQASWQNTHNPLILRQFIGNPALGWKVAWSDRMVSMFTSLWLFSLLWWRFRRTFRPTSWKVLILFLLPMALDGTTHLVSDLSGLHQGFRDNNAWLAALTQNGFPSTFYLGDAWGSFNSLMRLVSGVLFGVGMVWFGFPHLDTYFSEQAAWIRDKFDRKKLEI